VLPPEARDPAAAARLITAVEDDVTTHAVILRMKDALAARGVPLDGEQFERALLARAAVAAEARLPAMFVDDSVKVLFRNEFADFTRPSRTPPYLAGTYAFAAACKMASLRRFPAGPMDWELGGFPRSWLFKMARTDAVRALWFLTAKTHGFAPMFFLHVGRPPRNRLLVLEKEVDAMLHRIVRSLLLQPAIKGIVSSAWFFDQRAVEENPHLAWLNRPFLEHGGRILKMGQADETAGMLDGNRSRKDRFERGELPYHICVAVWPRAAAIRWLERRERVSSPPIP
jgi:hypothetical protein